MNIHDPHVQKYLARLLIAVAADVRAIKAGVANVNDQTTQLTEIAASMAAGVADLGSAMIDHDIKVQAELQALLDALKASGTTPDPAVAAVIQSISDSSAAVAKAASTIKSETAALAASVVPPSPPADTSGNTSATQDPGQSTT